MSYILEALKKAQAERQLGSAPDIHTPAPSHVPVAATRASRTPLLVGLSAGIVIAGIAGVLVWRAQAPVAAPAVVLASNGQGQGQGQGQGSGAAAVPAVVPAVPSPAPTPAATLAPAPAATPAPVSASAAAPVLAPVIAPSQARSELPARTALAQSRPPAAVPAPAEPAVRPRKSAQPDSTTAPAARSTPAAPVTAPVGNSPQAVYLPAPATARAADPAPITRAPEPAEDNLRTLQQLPEAIQREVPRVSVGGYIYSPNPADRLLLVDKTLRREGEELAPGLVLERLMPKYAVMNYRGTRYRVGY